MDKEMFEEEKYEEITGNQTSIMEQLDQTNLTLANANDLSNKFIGDAFVHFKQGTQAITRIRGNLDQIHKSLAAIKAAQPK